MFLPADGALTCWAKSYTLLINCNDKCLGSGVTDFSVGNRVTLEYLFELGYFFRALVGVPLRNPIESSGEMMMLFGRLFMCKIGLLKNGKIAGFQEKF